VESGVKHHKQTNQTTNQICCAISSNTRNTIFFFKDEQNKRYIHIIKVRDAPVTVDIIKVRDAPVTVICHAVSLTILHMKNVEMLSFIVYAFPLPYHSVMVRGGSWV
jgi:hypothetical protein